MDSAQVTRLSEKGDRLQARLKPKVTVYGGVYMGQPWIDALREDMLAHLPQNGRRYVVGTSHGTLEARRHAARGGVDALVLFCPPHGGVESARQIQANMERNFAREAWTALTPLGAFNSWLGMMPTSSRGTSSGGLGAHIRRQAQIDMVMNFGREGREKIKDIEDFPHNDVHAILAKKRVPTLIVTGELDEVVAPPDSHRIGEKIPTAEIMNVPGGDHLFFDGNQELLRHLGGYFRDVWLKEEGRVH